MLLLLLLMPTLFQLLPLVMGHLKRNNGPSKVQFT